MKIGIASTLFCLIGGESRYLKLTRPLLIGAQIMTDKFSPLECIFTKSKQRIDAVLLQRKEPYTSLINMITIYHNPRCQKSREALALLEQKGVEHSIRLYLNDEESMSAAEFEDVLDALDMDAIDLVRKNESVWKEEYKTLELDEDEIILAMIENPKLMERPIIVNGDRAVVARPAEKLLEVL
jgi:arsenate reductase